MLIIFGFGAIFVQFNYPENFPVALKFQNNEKIDISCRTATGKYRLTQNDFLICDGTIPNIANTSQLVIYEYVYANDTPVNHYLLYDGGESWGERNIFRIYSNERTFLKLRNMDKTLGTHVFRLLIITDSAAELLSDYIFYEVLTEQQYREEKNQKDSAMFVVLSLVMFSVFSAVKNLKGILKRE